MLKLLIMSENSISSHCCSKCTELVQISKSELEDKLKLGIKNYGFAPWVNWESERTGFGKLIRRMAFYPDFLPLFVSSDHYVDHLIKYRENEYNFIGSAYLTWNSRKADLMRSLGLNAVHILHPFLFWSQRQIPFQNDKNGTLVFWPHSSELVRVICNNLDQYFALLKKLPHEFHPIKFVVSSQDILSSDESVQLQVKQLFNGPFKVDSIGNILDKNYYKSFYDQITRVRLATSSMGGSQVFYSISAGVPYWIVGDELFSLFHKVDGEFIPWDPSVDYPNQSDLKTYNWFMNELRKFNEPISDELLEFVKSNLGFYATTTRISLAKEVWGSLLKHMYFLPKLYLNFTFKISKKLYSMLRNT